jgi:hypothetical protein
METIAVVRNGRVVEIIERRNGQEIVRKRDPADFTARLVDISARPDIKVGHVWGTEPEGYAERQAAAEASAAQPAHQGEREKKAKS